MNDFDFNINEDIVGALSKRTLGTCVYCGKAGMEWLYHRPSTCMRLFPPGQLEPHSCFPADKFTAILFRFIVNLADLSVGVSWNKREVGFGRVKVFVLYLKFFPGLALRIGFCRRLNNG